MDCASFGVLVLCFVFCVGRVKKDGILRVSLRLLACFLLLCVLVMET